MRRILNIVSITLLTAIFLALFLWKSNLSDVWRIIKTTNAAWLAAGFAVNAATLLLRSVRWRVLIDYRRPPSFYATYFANGIGYALSATLPIRAGDVARPALLARRSHVRFSDALGTVLTERVLDLVSILLLLVLFCIRRWNTFNDPIVHGTAFVSGGIVAVMLLLMLGVYLFPDVIRRIHVRLGKYLPARFREPWERFFDAFAATLQLARLPMQSAIVVITTGAIWLCLLAQYSFTLLATHRPLPFDASLFLSAATTVGIAIPTPGGVGGFHKMCQWVLMSYYHFDVDSSVAVAVLLHVVSTLPTLVAAAVLMLHEGLSLRQLSRETTVDET